MSDNKRVLRIHVTNPSKDDRINITVPLGLARLARIGGIGESISKRYGVDFDALVRDIEDMPDGQIVDVLDEKSGDHVEIYVESRVAHAAAV